MLTNIPSIPAPTPAKNLQAGDEILIWGLRWKVVDVTYPLVMGRVQLFLKLDPDVMMIACNSNLLVDKI